MQNRPVRSPCARRKQQEVLAGSPEGPPARDHILPPMPHERRLETSSGAHGDSSRRRNGQSAGARLVSRGEQPGAHGAVGKARLYISDDRVA